MKRSILLFLVFSTINLFAQIPAGYYDSATGTGETLKTSLYNIIDGHNILSYTPGLWNLYYISDVDRYYENNGTVLDMYSENPSGIDSYEYELGADQCGNVSANEGGCYNREHSFPKSWFNDVPPMDTDAFHIYPTDGQVNSKRGNYPYGEVPNPSLTTSNGSKVGSCDPTLGYSGTVFEPIDEFKGDLARTYFYMATRYENKIAGWENNEPTGDAVLNGTSYPCYEQWFLNLLLTWHYQDAVSQKEIDRNNAIYYGDSDLDITGQGNRNPFIDHPEWVTQIWDPNPDTENPTAPSNLIANNETNNSIQLSWDAATDNVAVASYDIYMDGSLTDNSLTTNYLATGLTAETNYSFYVIAKDPSGNTSTQSNTANATTLSDPTYIIYEDFNDCATVPVNFVTYNEASDKDWTCQTQYGFDNTGCYQMNGYQEYVLSKDWLITTNPIDFTQYTNETLSVYLKYAYGTMPLELVYSTDYVSANNPSNYTWLPVPNVSIDTPTGSSEDTVQELTAIDISSMNQSAYLAFKYYSNGSPTRWNVDNFRISVDSNLGTPTNQQNHLDFSIYPNPNNGQFFIRGLTEMQNSIVQIQTMQGVKISQQKIDSLNTPIFAPPLSNGVYLVRIVSGTKSGIQKLIIN